MTLTKYQQKLLNLLKKGRKFHSTISGWHYDNKRLRVETQNALWATGELVEIQLQGRMISEWYVCHRSQTEKAAQGRKILRTKHYTNKTTSLSWTENH